MSNYRLALSSIPFAGILFFLCCTPIVYSPHAQNEMLSPHNPQGQTHEIGAAFALSKWMITQGADTAYIQTYPGASFSLLHCAYYGWSKAGGLGGIEIVGLPAKWWFDEASGAIFWLRPYVGMQIAGAFVTCRFNIAPFHFYIGFDESDIGFSPSSTKLSWYQLTALLHNEKTSNHTYWVGIKNSPSAIGLLGGYEHSFTEKNFMRLEYTYLMKTPIPIFLYSYEDESIGGSVHYLTLGFFRRMK